MERYLAVIRENRLFEGVPAEVIRSAVLPYCTVKTINKGANLFLPLDRVTNVYLLLDGRMKLVYYSENGTQDIRNLLLPPRLVGIDLICTRTKIAPYQATALERCTVLGFPSEIILRPGRMPEAQRQKCIDNLLLIISNINMQNQYRLAILARKGLRERITVYLTMQANKAHGKTFTIPFTREEMASFLCVNRSALSHELSKMEREGIIAFSKNTFTLLREPPRVYDAADGL